VQQSYNQIGFSKRKKAAKITTKDIFKFRCKPHFDVITNIRVIGGLYYGFDCSFNVRSGV